MWRMFCLRNPCIEILIIARLLFVLYVHYHVSCRNNTQLLYKKRKYAEPGCCPHCHTIKRWMCMKKDLKRLRIKIITMKIYTVCHHFIYQVSNAQVTKEQQWPITLAREFMNDFSTTKCSTSKCFPLQYNYKSAKWGKIQNTKPHSSECCVT